MRRCHSLQQQWRLKDVIVDDVEVNNYKYFRRLPNSQSFVVLDPVAECLIKTDIPKTDYPKIGEAAKPYVSKNKTVFIPDTRNRIVLEKDLNSDSIIRTFGFDTYVDLAVEYSCDEGTGTVLENETWHASTMDATLVNCSWSSDPYPDNGLIINSNGYVSIAANASIINVPFLEQRSVEIWIKPTSLAGDQIIYREGDEENGFHIYISLGKLYFVFINSFNILIDRVKFISTSNISTGVWAQLVLTFDSRENGSGFSAYVNGVQVGSIANTLTMDSPLVFTTIGNCGSGMKTRSADATVIDSENWPFLGTLRNFKIWNKCLSQSQVSDLLDTYTTVDSALSRPIAICQNQAGSVFVADQIDGYIRRFSSNGDFEGKFGGIDGGIFEQGKFNTVADITIDAYGVLYVLDSFYKVIQKFDALGNFITSFGLPPIYGYSSIVAIDCSGNYIAYFVDTSAYHKRIVISDLDGSEDTTKFCTVATNYTSEMVDIAIVEIRKEYIEEEATIVSTEVRASASYTDNSRCYIYDWNYIGEPLLVNKWTIDNYNTVVDGAFFNASPATLKGLAIIGDGRYYVTDQNIATDAYSSRGFVIDKPKVRENLEVAKGLDVSPDGYIYVSHDHTIKKLDTNLLLVPSFGNNGSVDVEEAGAIAVDDFGNVVAVSLEPSPNNIVVLSENGTLVNRFNIMLSNDQQFAIDPYNRLATLDAVLAPDAIKVYTLDKGFGTAVNMLYKHMMPIQEINPVFNGLAEYAKIYWNERKGLESDAPLQKLKFTMAEYRYLENIRGGIYANIGIDVEQKQNVANILVRAFKLYLYKYWREQEAGMHDADVEKITYSSYYFNYNASKVVDFVEVPYRSTLKQRLEWLNKIAGNASQYENIALAHQNTLTELDDDCMQPFRDDIIMLAAGLDTTSNSLVSKAEKLQRKLQVDFQYNCCMKVTRVSFALTTLQNFVNATRLGSIDLGEGVTVQPTLTEFDTKWQTMGSYETWRAATFVYLYPENLLLPTIRPVQSEMFRTITEETSDNSDFSETDASRVSAMFAEYTEGVCNLELVGATRMAARDASEAAQEKKTGIPSTLNFVFGLDANYHKVYYAITKTDINKRTFTEVVSSC